MFDTSKYPSQARRQIMQIILHALGARGHPQCNYKVFSDERNTTICGFKLLSSTDSGDRKYVLSVPSILIVVSGHSVTL